MQKNNSKKKPEYAGRKFLTSRPKLWLLFVVVLILALSCVYAGLTHRLPSTELNSLIAHLGADLIAALLVYAAFDLVLQKLEEDEAMIHYKKLNLQDILNGISHANIATSNDDTNNYDILIWDSWTPLFGDSCFDSEGDFKKDSFGQNAFTKAVKEAAGRGIDFHILLIEPGSNGMNMRQIDLDGEVEHMKRRETQRWDDLEGNWDVELNIQKNLRCFHELYKLLNGLKGSLADPKRITLKLYNKPPDIALYDWGSKAVASFFPKKQLSHEIEEQYEYNPKIGLGRLLNRQFDTVWSDSKIYDCEKPQKITVQLHSTEQSPKTMLFTGEVEFIRNDDDPKYYPFCIWDKTETIKKAFNEFKSRHGIDKLRVVVKKAASTPSTQEKSPNLDLSREDNNDWESQEYRIEECTDGANGNKTLTRMDKLFNVKYGTNSGRKIFRLQVLTDTTQSAATQTAN